MIDKMLQVGSAFDWISPAAATLQNVMRGPSFTFLIPYDDCPLSGREIELALKKRRVACWGLMVVDGTLTVSVKQAQAQQAQRVLESQGVPIENGLSAESRRAHKRPLPRNAAGRTGNPFAVFDEVFK